MLKIEMRTITFSLFVAIVSPLAADRLEAQNAATTPYLDTSLPPEQRAADLVKRMTVEEKVHPIDESVARYPKVECACLQLVERGAAWMVGRRSGSPVQNDAYLA